MNNLSVWIIYDFITLLSSMISKFRFFSIKLEILIESTYLEIFSFPQ